VTLKKRERGHGVLHNISENIRKKGGKSQLPVADARAQGNPVAMVLVLLYYYYSKKKARGKSRHAHAITFVTSLPVAPHCSPSNATLYVLIYYLWSYRDLTYIGKVTVVKTLALPVLVQCLTVLPNPPDSVLNDIEKIFDNFLWNGKKDKIKRSVIINEYEEGELKIPHIQSFNKALKMSWLHKLLDPFNHSPSKVLLLDYIRKWGGSNISYLSKEGLEKIAEKVNPFWKDVFMNLSELKQEKGELVDIQHVLSQPI
jgi:hypothetical protein